MKELFTFALLAALTLPVTAQTSELWGVNGERWDPRSRLPDFSFAGYHSGEAPVPNVPRGFSVEKSPPNGAGPTDGRTAFPMAVGIVKTGPIELPPARYR